MKSFHRPSESRLRRVDAWKTSAYAFVPYETNFGALCGFADDVVEGGRGFPLHPHRDMEISTILLAGAQSHEDTTGRQHLLTTRSVQTMSAGTGIMHSEVNASASEPFHSYQIWVYPRQRGAAPRYETFTYEPAQAHNRFLLALSPDRREGSAMIGQDAFFSLASLDAGARSTYSMHAPHDGVYVHCASGVVTVAGVRLGPGDAIGVWETERVLISADEEAELVLVEVPMTLGVRG